MAPPLAGTFLSLPSAKNAIQRPSGDQNGSCASSVPVSDSVASRSIGRRQRTGLPPAAVATNTIACPSGEIAKCGAFTVMVAGLDENVALSGAEIANSIASVIPGWGVG